MGFLKDTWKRFLEIGIPVSLILYLAVGLIFIWLGQEKNVALTHFLQWLGFGLTDPESVKIVKDTSKIFGQTIAISGIATSILRTNFFSNILQKQLFKVVYTEELLKNRKDIMDIWGRVSKVLYSNKFPDIADEINETITRKYFPIDKHYYYYKVDHSVQIEVMDKVRRLISIKETQIGIIKIHRGMLSFLNPWDNSNKITVQGGIDMNGDDDSETSVTVSEGSFNGNKVAAEFFTEKIKNKFQYKFCYNLQKIQGDSIEYEYTVTKVLFMQEDIDFIGTICNNIHYNYTLYVNYKDDDMRVWFIDLGTAKDFKDVNKNFPKGQIAKKYDGVIFPGQGFRLVLKIA